MSENDKKVPLIVRDIHTKWGIWDTPFQKRRFQGFISEILRMAGLLGENLFFLTPLGQPKFQQFSDFLCIFMLSFW